MIDYKYKLITDNLYSAAIALGLILVSRYFLKLVRKKYPNNTEIVPFVIKSLEWLWIFLLVVALYNMMEVYFLL